MHKKIKMGQTVRLPNGQTGKVVSYDNQRKKYGVQVETQRLWELVWYAENLLKVTK